MSNLVSRGLNAMRAIISWGGKEQAHLEPHDLDRIREQLQECAEGAGGEVTTRQRAARLAHTYLQLDDDARHAFLRMIALEFGPDPARVAEAHEAYQQAIGTTAQWNAEASLRAAMRSKRIRILTQFNAIPQGVKFLVDLRADLLRFLKDDPELKALDRELEARLNAWFDVGFLELRRITWESPAALLEKLVQYEAVHEIRSWMDLKNRLDADRRCYAFFHPRMPLEPLIFVEVALVEELAGNVQRLLDEMAPLADPEKANTAIFYSISNTQVGLRGVSFGNFLLKRVVDDLKRDLPGLKQFATLSPMPRLRHWLREHPEVLDDAVTDSEWKKLTDLGVPAADADTLLAMVLEDTWLEQPGMPDALQPALSRVAARYLVSGRGRGDLPFDPVARFHLGNGARIERLNWMGDTSSKGIKQSFGLMVNYLYDPDTIEANVEAFVTEGSVATSNAIRKLAK
ncbi:malonyl-CoA decarboxylase [Nitrogeniibacter aestuarii]|uniref:malonyl-CoA decarboxylase n=1 Tax=Nitrogeniibacter aestuarii TaxID=2815343 RepID=UPI001D0F5323|nr:malonyl-CoA decarboxylase [Nitrogeniibacter aestuarii]